MTSPTDAPRPALGPDPSSRCPDCGRQLAAGHDVDCAAIAAPIVRERFSKADAPPPALGELARRAVAELREAAQEYHDSALACDTPALRPFRRRRNLRAIALGDAADLILQLVALATGGGAGGEQDQLHSGSTMKNQPQVQGLSRDASVCGATWLADYGPLPCDRPAGHTEPHRCYGSQGPIQWRRVSAEPARCACGGVIEGNGGIQDYGGTHEGYVWGGNCTECGKGYGENDDDTPPRSPPPRAAWPKAAPVDPPIPHCPYCGKLSTAVVGDAFLGVPKCDGRCVERARSLTPERPADAD